MNIKNIIWGALGALAFLAILGLVGADDFRHEILQQVTYCDNVAAGVWPDYKNESQYCGEAYAALAEHWPEYSGGLKNVY